MAEFEITLADIGEYIDFMAHQGEDGEIPIATTVFDSMAHQGEILKTLMEAQGD